MAKKAKAAVKTPVPPETQDDGWADGQGIETEVAETEDEAKTVQVPKGHLKTGRDKTAEDYGDESVDARLKAAEARAAAAEAEAKEATDRMQSLLEQVANGTSATSLTARVNEAAGRPKLGSLPSVSQPADKRKPGVAVPMIRLYCVPNHYTILIAEEEVEEGKDNKNRMAKRTINAPVVWVFHNHRCNVPAADFEKAVDNGKYEYWGGSEWISAPDLAEEIKRNTREGARFMERMYKKSVYANKSGADSELQFAMEIHQELKSLGLL